MKRPIYAAAILSVLLCAGAIFAYKRSGSGAAYSIAVTFGTIAYHFLMRLAVGFAAARIMRGKADYNMKWYRLRGWEDKLYRLLRLKRWKDRMPTFEPENFDPKKRTWDEIAQAMCQAEVVHEIIALLSFAPILFARFFGALPVFVITSILSAAVDLIFAAMQRYNRPRVIRLIRQEMSRKKSILHSHDEKCSQV